MGRWKTRREERRITARSIHGPTYGQRADLHDLHHPAKMRRSRCASKGATCVCWRCGNIEGAPVITPQKFIAELRMLRTRAKELGLPITANMIGRAIEVCESERAGDLLTVRRRNEKEQKKCATPLQEWPLENTRWPSEVLSTPRTPLAHRWPAPPPTQGLGHWTARGRRSYVPERTYEHW